MRKFEEIKNENKNKCSKSGWFSDCAREQIPYITIYLKGKLADVHWDYITYNINLDVMLSDKESEFVQKVENLYANYLNKKSECRVNCNLVTFSNLDVELARHAASELYDLVDSHVQKLIHEGK